MSAASKKQIESHARHGYWRAKRLVELVLCASIILSLLPLFLIVAVVVALDVGFPALFWQQRPGARGIPFRVYKFRTMAGSHDASGRPVPDQERVSAVGQFLRRSRLDELPQLFNVLFGEMSFTGPRPLLPRDQFVGLEARLAVPPGITGWAQINGGRDVTAAEKAALDIWYVNNASLSVELRICVQTFLMMLQGERRNEAAIEAAWRDLTDEHPAGSDEHPAGSTTGSERFQPLRHTANRGSEERPAQTPA